MEKMRKYLAYAGIVIAGLLLVVKGIENDSGSPVPIGADRVSQVAFSIDSIPVGVVVGRVLRVYDGDTFYCDIPQWPAIVGSNIGIRLAGIDTPEIRGTSGNEKLLAIKAKTFASDKISGAGAVVLRNVKRGKYFRIIADVIVDGNDLSVMLLEAGLAKPYDGGTRPDWNVNDENTESKN